jgi:MFS family permease
MQGMGQASTSPSASLPRTVATAVLASTVGALPALLVGGLAVLVREDLGFDEFQLGFAISAFFAASVVFSVPAGLVSERLGPRRALLAGITITLVALLGVAITAQSWGELVAWLFIAGTGNTIGQVGANHLLATAVSPSRQGLSFGIKQSSIPLAGILAGLAVPVIGLTIGWRWAFVLATGGVLVVFWLIGRPGPFRHSAARRRREGDAPLPALLVVALAAGLGAAAGSALVSFTVESAVARGFDASAAGLLLTFGSLCGVSMRIVSGWFADRLGHGSLLVAVVLQLVGAVGFLLLALAGTAGPMTILATALAFGGGWGYQGLILLAVSRSNPTSPATAMAIVRLGPSTGAMLGPLIAGALVSGSGYELTWLLAAVVSVVAAGLLVTGRVMLLRHLRSRSAEDEPSRTGIEAPG